MKTRYKIIIVGIVLASIVFGTYQSLMYQCGTLHVFMETPRTPNLWKCLEIWKNQSEPEPEPEPIPDSESLQQQKQRQAKLHTQEVIMTDYRGNQHQIDAINEYRNEFESGYFLEQFILFTNKQNYEKNDLINFVFVEWGYQQQECTFPKVEVYFRSYENYNQIEKISEWQKPKDRCFSISSDSDGYLIMDISRMPGITPPHTTCTIPGEYRVVASNLEDESKKEYGYYTCQQEKLVGEPQPWMEPPE